jgi:pyruvate ferredoxin oxidoreductase alpha subunit
LDDEPLKKYLGKYKPQYSLLNIKSPITMGPADLPDFYMEHKKQQHEAMKEALEIVKQVGKQYKEISGRGYETLQSYKLQDAEAAIVVVGSTSGTVRETVDLMRKKGFKVGLLKLRLFRPFPKSDIVNALKDLKVIAIMDKSDSFGSFGGPLFLEVRNSLFKNSNAEIINYIYGLGGRDVKVNDIEEVFKNLLDISKTGKVHEYINYLGVR